MTSRTIKLTILSIILAPATFYLAYLFNQLETDPEATFLITQNAIRFLIQFVVAFSTFTILASVLAATSLKPVIQLGVSTIQGLVFWIGLFFTNNDPGSTNQTLKDVGLSLLLTLGIFYFIYIVTADQKLLIKFSLRKIYPRNIRTLLIIITILLSGNFYFSYSSKIQREGFELPPAVFESITDPIINMVEENLSSQVEGLLGDKIKEIGVEQQGGMEKKFLAEELEETLQEGEGRKKLLEFGGITLQPQGEFDLKAIGPTIQKKIQEAIKPYQAFIAPAVTLMLFLSLQLIDVVIAAVALIALSIIFKILVMIKFARFETKTEEVQRLVFY